MQKILKYNGGNRMRVSYTKVLQDIFQPYAVFLYLWHFALLNSMVFPSRLILCPLAKVCDLLIISKHLWENYYISKLHRLAFEYNTTFGNNLIPPSNKNLVGTIYCTVPFVTKSCFHIFKNISSTLKSASQSVSPLIRDLPRISPERDERFNVKICFFFRISGNGQIPKIASVN